jgi:DNA-binding response OmpR family regulator
MPDLILDPKRRLVWCRGHRLDLARKPTRLKFLTFLARHPKSRFSVEELVEQVWQRRSISYETDRLVYVTVHRLRQDLGSPEWICEEEGRYGLASGLRVETREE